METKKKILIISSVDPYIRSGRLGVDYKTAFEKEGYLVDFLTKYKVKNHPDYFSVYNCFEKQITLNKIISFILKFPYKSIRKVYRILFNKTNEFRHIFFYRQEKKPPVRNKLLLKNIPANSNYDFVFILFWQGMLSASSIDYIHNILKTKIIISCEDYSPMTGGCHFIGNCKQYNLGCGRCPEFYSKKLHDFTYKNVQYKIKIYDKVHPIFLMNKYMKENYAINGYVLKNQDIQLNFSIINEDEFKPENKIELRKELNLPISKKIIFFACQNLNDPRKGIQYILESLNLFYKNLSNMEKENIIVITAGNSDPRILTKIPFIHKDFGYVDFNLLPKLFALSDIYLSGAIIDAGPMMVNQSISCGTPVIAFDIGTAQEVIKNKGTGYCAIPENVNDFFNGINWWYNLTNEDYMKVSKTCRELALSLTSYKACTDFIINLVE